MYTQQDLDQINAQEQKRWRLLVIPEVLLLAALVYSLVIRVEWLDELHEAFPEFEIRMDPLSLSVACHIGPGARAVTLTKILHVN